MRDLTSKVEHQIRKAIKHSAVVKNDATAYFPYIAKGPEGKKSSKTDRLYL